MADGPFVGPEQIHQISGLTGDEKAVMEALVEAWNRFIALNDVHPDHQQDFRRGIHECQRILASRMVKRVFPKYWK